MFRKIILRTLAFFLMIVTSFNVFAQSKSRIVGTIIDANAGSPIVGATIKVLPSGKTVLSDGSGKFIIEFTLGSKIELEVSSVGYTKKQINEIEASVNNELIISLTPASKNLDAVVVTASARRETVSNLYSIQRNSPGIQDGISADIIKKSPDRNTGEVLRRVSGATIQDNKFVVIRGLNERYNVALLNKGILPSTEPDKKAFSFDIIPASAIDNVIIYKTPLPDLPGDFAGGLVQVVTKDYPSKKYTEISVSSSANDLTTGQNFYGTSHQGKYDQIGFFDQSRNIAADYAANRGSKFITLPAAEKQRISKLFPNTYAYEGMLMSMPSLSVGINGGNSFLKDNGAKWGLIYMVSYGNNRKVSQRNRLDYMLSGDMLYDNQTDVYDRKNSLSGLVTLTYAKNKNKISFKSLFNNEFSNSLGLRNGYDISNNPERFDYKSYNSEQQSTGIGSLVLDGSHAVTKKLSFDWTTSMTATYKNQPDQKIISFRTPFNAAAPYYIKLGNENSPEIRNAGRIFSDLNEKIYNAGFNFVYSFKVNEQSQKIKFGTLNYYRDRSTVVDALGYASLDFRGVTIFDSKATDFSTIFSPQNVDAFKLTLATIGNNSTSYTANAMLNAGYLMYEGTIASNLKFAGGARAEKYKQALQALGQADVKFDNIDVLPSALLTYNLTKRSNLRLGVSQSVNRPEFRELASYSVFDYDNFLVVRGNPDLKRSLINNADFRYELYPSSGEILSLSVFYKGFKNPIEQINAGNDVLSYKNAISAKSYGAELELRKKLDFIGTEFFSNITFYTNLSYMLGTVNFNGSQLKSPLQGQSPYIINNSISYGSDKGTAVTIMYNRVGPRLKFRAVNGAAFNIYEMPRDLIDFQISQKLLKGKVEAKLTFSDLLAQPFRWYYKFDAAPANNYFETGKDKFINYSKFGRTVNIGLKFNL